MWVMSDRDTPGIPRDDRQVRCIYQVEAECYLTCPSGTEMSVESAGVHGLDQGLLADTQLGGKRSAHKTGISAGIDELRETSSDRISGGERAFPSLLRGSSAPS